MFEAKGKGTSQLQAKSVEVSTIRPIRQISMFVSYSSSYYLCKLRLLDDKGQNIVNLDWTNKFDGRGKWITRDIPVGKEIIGLYCTTTKYDFSIPFLGFIVWSPPTDSLLSEENSNSPKLPATND